ncbi:MAG: type I-C CRISPR-associated protein Cas8c/Csd1 [Planctomycetaceae bacterium]|nr:type I-C CRISPR-associated protein Cas8c/Csd1 [Planctomycetaceae bacterium]
MILQALNSYYERLKNDPDAEVAPYGFSYQDVSFEIVLELDGTLIDVRPLWSLDNKNYVPTSLIVPGYKSRSGRTPCPYFLRDNPLYMFGCPPKGKDGSWAAKRFEAFRTYHIDNESEINDEQYSAVCEFLRNYRPGSPPCDPTLLGRHNGVFRIRGAQQRVHDRESVAFWWTSLVSCNDSNEAVYGQCLITGELAALAKTHDPPLGSDIPQAENSAKIVSFNFKAADSFGKNQSYNSPVSLKAAFQYSTALKRLTHRESKQRIQIGDATTVFWTEQPSPVETMLPWVFEPTKAEDDALKNKLHSVLTRIANGQYPDEFGDRETPFYVLGLSPNAARISVRFWWVSTLGKLIENLRQHFVDLAIQSEPNVDFPAVWQLLRETVRDSKDLPPQLSGAVITSILTGAAYPSGFFVSALRRIRVERRVNSLRAAILKSHLNRNHRIGRGSLQKPLSTVLEEDRAEIAYQLGRLFAVLEKIEQDGTPQRSSGVRDRLFASASAAPVLVFPQAIRQSMHNLSKIASRPELTKEAAARIRRYMESHLWAITHHIDHFPENLDLEAQALFIIGYHQQNRWLWTSGEKRLSIS